MHATFERSTWKAALMTSVAALVLTGAAMGQQAPTSSAEHEAKASPVVRSFGEKGGYRTEVRSETKGTLGQEDRRQVSLLAGTQKGDITQ